MADNLFICAECGASCKNRLSLFYHISVKHDSKEYYDKHIDASNHKCPYCDNERKFKRISMGYCTTCMSKSCESKRRSENNCFKDESVKAKIKQTKLTRYGDENYTNSVKAKETKQERYGDENYSNRAKAVNTCKERFDNGNYCNRSKAKQTNIERYGCEFSFQSELVKDKIKQTKLARYGDENFTNRDKCYNTFNERYGTKDILTIESIKEKIKQTKLERYGDENFTNREKAKTTLKEHFGVENPGESEEIKERIKIGNIKRFGVPFAFQSDNNKTKSKETMLKRYGVEHYTQTNEYHHKKRKKYNYNGIEFDSNDEIKLYKFCIENGIDIKYQPISFEYSDSLNNKHKYFPDFEICGKLYEVKGDHLWKDGHLFFPFRKNISEERLRVIDANYAGKDECIRINNVEVILSSKLDDFINKLKEVL